jgi:hypothetical protein
MQLNRHLQAPNAGNDDINQSRSGTKRDGKMQLNLASGGPRDGEKAEFKEMRFP